MNLIIVESPTKARTLGRFLGSSYRITATMGHIRDLPAKELGVEVEKDFEPKYVPVTGKKKTIDELKKLAQGAAKIYLATDPDREGEAIAYHVGHMISENQKSKVKNQKLQRISFHEITKSAIEKALTQPGQINMPLVDAQQARRVLDRLVGYKLSPLLWKKIRRGLSAGRVQSVTVELVVEREREIEAFKAEEYWEIFAELARSGGSPVGPAADFPPEKPTKGPLPGGLPTRVTRTQEKVESFIAKLVKQNGKTVKIGDGESAGKVAGELKAADYRVAAVEKKEVAQNPVPPFTTSTLQQAAARRLGFSSKRTMQVAQKLYEEGLITYHRTDSVALAKEAVDQIRDFIGKTYGTKYRPESPRFYKTKAKVVQEAHEAIRPTVVSQNSKFPHFAKASGGGQIPPLRQGFEGQANSILGTRDEERLYDLIWKRAVASQMSAAVWDQTKIRVGAKGATNEYELLAEGKVIKFEGWLALYSEIKNQKSKIKNTDQKDKNEELTTNNLLPKTKSSEADENAGLLPPVAEGESLDLLSLDSQQKFTQPPARYSEATLIKELEKRGIGRPSTYAPTVSTVQTRQYVEKIEGRFHPTQLGITVNDFLVKHFDKIMDYDFTAKMEDDLDEIAKGERAWVPVVREFFTPFEKKLAQVEAKAKRAKVPVEKTGEKCPECGQGEVVIRTGRFGKFLSCSRFPECKYTAAYVPKLEGVKCPECGGEVVIRRTKKGKQFYGCANYPKCKWASWRKPK